MTDETLSEEIARNTNPDNGLRPIDPSTLQLSEQQKAEMFDEIVSRVVFYHHKIEDVTQVAAGFIKKFRQSLNWTMKCNDGFLREYGIEHLKRDKTTGEIKGNSYKTLGAGGGVFFRQKPGKLTVNATQESLKNLYFNLPRATEIPTMDEFTKLQACLVEHTVTTYKVVSAELLQKEMRARGLKPEKYGIEFIEEPADPFYYCSVGSDKAWSSLKSKQLLTMALDNTDIEDDTKQLEVDDDSSTGILTTEDG